MVGSSLSKHILILINILTKYSGKFRVSNKKINARIATQWKCA